MYRGKELPIVLHTMAIFILSSDVDTTMSCIKTFIISLSSAGLDMSPFLKRV